MSLSTFFVKSYGCQMNIYDSEKITSILENKGLKLNKYAEDADLIACIKYNQICILGIFI